MFWKTRCLNFAIIILFMLISSELFAGIKPGQDVKQDTLAEKMLLYQRNNGGWTQYQGNATNYRKHITAAQKAVLLNDKNKTDATIDDKSTTLEINYLIKAYTHTKNKKYLRA